MIRSLFVAKTGLDAQQTSLDIIANNLANASTTGYKRYKGVFEDMLYQTMRSAGTRTDGENVAPTGLQMGTGSRAAASQPIFTQGVLQRTGNPLDLAIDGNGFFRIDLGNGLVGYTRDGNFTKDAQNRLVTAMGYPVADFTIDATATAVNIAASGEVTVTLPGQSAPQQAGTINTVTFANQTYTGAFGAVTGASGGEPRSLLPMKVLPKPEGRFPPCQLAATAKSPLLVWLKKKSAPLAVVIMETNNARARAERPVELGRCFMAFEGFAEQITHVFSLGNPFFLKRQGCRPYAAGLSKEPVWLRTRRHSPPVPLTARLCGSGRGSVGWGRCHRPSPSQGCAHRRRGCQPT
jgi:flagellar basal body rod protein FlgG